MRPSRPRRTNLHPLLINRKMRHRVIRNHRSSSHPDGDLRSITRSPGYLCNFATITMFTCGISPHWWARILIFRQSTNCLSSQHFDKYIIRQQLTSNHRSTIPRSRSCIVEYRNVPSYTTPVLPSICGSKPPTGLGFPGAFKSHTSR